MTSNINNFNNNNNSVEFSLPELGEMFKVQKGKRESLYRIVKSKNFKGCYDLLRCTNTGYSCSAYVWQETLLTDCQSIEECFKQAYYMT